MASHISQITRRQALLWGAGGLAMTATGCATTPLATEPSRKPVGIQLYTARDEMARDVTGTLTRIAEIGYDEVEFAGYFDVPPAELRSLVSDLGMAAPSTHVQPHAARDEPMSVIDPAVELGCDYAVIAWLPPEERETLDQWKAWADVLNGFAEKCSDAGLRFAYHNHDFEFQPIDGVMPMDVFLERCDPDLVGFELDFYWVRAAGQDSSSILAANPGRFPLCHVKDMDEAGAMADVGSGVIDFAELFASPGAAGIKHFFVERDDATAPFESAQNSYSALAPILAE